MKIGLVLEHFDPQRGGLAHWTWQFAGRLTALGHEVHVVACDFAKPDAGMPVILHPVEPSRSPLRRAAGFEQALRKLQLDVIHDMGVGWYADIFHAHSGSTKAAHEHGLMRIPRWRQIRFWGERRYREQAEIERRQNARKKSLIVAVSQMDRGYFQSLYDVPMERIRRIYNGVDTDRFSLQECSGHREPTRRMLECTDDEAVFLFVGYDLRRKNAESAIRALSLAVSNGFPARLVIVGGERPEPSARLARKLGLSDRVALIGGVPDVRPYLAAADVYLHPSWYDPFGLAVFEAFACGLPVITTRFTGASELMADGEHGFIISDPADIVAIARKMEELLDPELRKRMGAAARLLALQQTLESQTEQFLALYREIAPSSGASSSSEASE
ncbi:MAG: glycosyltransferase family 4 protein, partial [Terrimicrobiaceae bacterium]